MAQKTLNAFVVIGGRVDNSFGQIGTALISMGQTVDEISQKLINFGKESVEVYRDYQDSMLDAQVALSTTYGRGTRELQSVMKTLDAQATEWAASTIFHTDDVANAIAQAAHANWDLDMILTGIPNAMRLAQAGSMDLSEAVDFIIKSVNGAGLGFGDLTEWIDEWTYAANSSAGDVEEFGEAMLKMGNTMKFAGSKEELLTMIAILHDSGTVGSAAGTLLRNSMLRLIAPTKKAKEAMAELSVTQEEMDEALSEVDGDTAAAVSRLEELGFSVYDDSGKLKDFVTIFHDLGKATEGMTDDEKYAIWSAIFPTRTITGGMALIEALTDDMNELYKSLVGGEAEGYGEYAAETMMGGLTGAIETFNSKFERLKQTTGEALEGDVTYWTDKLGQFVDKIATMDDANFQGLVGGLEVIAGAGPGLIIAGGAFRFLGYALGTTWGRIALAAIAVGALSKAINDYNEAKFEENFGTMDLDPGPLREKLSEIKQGFDESTQYITGFRDALQQSIDKYNEASQTFSSKLLNDMLTKKELTKEDLDVYTHYGEQMIGAVKQGLQDSADLSAEFWAYLFKGENDPGDEYAKSPAFQGLISLLREDYEKNSAEVEAIGEEMRAAITAAFDNDGVIDEAEYEKFKEYFRQLNEAMAKAQAEAENEQMLIERQIMFDKAQTLSYDAIMDYIDSDIIPQRQAELDKIDTEYARQIAKLKVQYASDYEAAETDEERAAVTAKYNERLAGAAYFSEGEVTDTSGLEALHKQKQAEIYAPYDAQILGLMETAGINESPELKDANALIGNLVERVLTGAMSEADARNVLAESGYADKTGTFAYLGFGGPSQAEQANKYWQREIEKFGGREEIENRIGYYQDVGNEAMAQRLSILLGKTDFYKGNNELAAQSRVSQLTGGLYAPDNQTYVTGGAGEQPNTIPLRLDEYGEPVMHTQAQETTALPSPDELLSGGASPYTIPMTIEGAEAAAALAHEQAQSELDSEGDVTIQTEADTQGFDALPSPDELAKMYGISTTVNVEATPEQTASPYTIPLTLEGAGAEASTARSEMDSILEPPIDTSVAFPGAVSVAASVYQSIKSQFKDIIQHVQIVTHGGSYPGMATGGRATEPVVYAEAGPEWFIPERHDRNTANLIAMAAHASGFSLAELATMSGARLFADGGTVGGSLPSLGWSEMDYSDSSSSGDSSGGNTYDVHYAPVIHAENAEGVDKALQDDKKRLKKLLKEIDEERELIGSVVSY